MSDTVTPTAAPAATGTTATPEAPKAPEAPKSLKIKGLEFRSEDDAYAEIERGRQSGKLLTEAQKRLLESTKRDKTWEDLKGEVKTKKDAKRVIEHLGLSKDEAVEIFGKWLYQEEVLPKEMSPERRRIKELEDRQAQYEEEKAGQKRQADEAELDRSSRQEAARLKTEIEKIISDKKIPATRLALRRVANYLSSYSEAGVDIPVDKAAEMVAEDYKQEFGELFDDTSPEQMIAFLGEKRWHQLAKKVSDWALGKSRASISAQQMKEPVSRKPVEKEEKMSPQDFVKYLGKLR